MVIGLIVGLVVLALAVLPSLYVQNVIKKHATPRPDFPGTGAELAVHLIERMRLDGVTVEKTAGGDHYDPSTKTVRLSPANHDGRSLSAVVIAAHEIGHAMQHATSYGPLVARTRLAGQAIWFERIGMAVMLTLPVVAVIAKAPHLMVLQLVVGFLFLGVTILMHAVTLPVEFDASFNRALPVLEKGEFIPPEDLPAAREILRAAALTYVAAAAFSLIDIMRWLRVIRF